MASSKASSPPIALIILAGAAFGLLVYISARWIPGMLVALLAIPALSIMWWLARYLLRQGRPS